MAKKETLEIVDNKLCVGITRLVSLAKILYMSELDDAHKIPQMLERGLPAITKNKERIFALEDVFSWYAKNCMETDELKALKLQHEIQRLEAQTKKIDFDYKVAKKEFVSVKEVSQSQSELIAYLKTTDLNFVKQIPDLNIRTLINQHFKDKWDKTANELETMKESELDSN